MLTFQSLLPDVRETRSILFVVIILAASLLRDWRSPESFTEDAAHDSPILQELEAAAPTPDSYRAG